ncbi:Aste57867_1301 [Aphanomyces stellatus]|uniref:Aste57867_1301 protein n=1 Tax=Aphanomyces stellatus TaxID=120398 RepID=A0A485K7J6_9STRA|nr:hypothetical protein As57867_001300 [Aphanomyces stellatus]VFT78520.1 Aste57867_1301 [Aphanomyces stellatus]
MSCYLSHGSRLLVLLAIVADAQKTDTCPYFDLPREVAAVRMWDASLCRAESLLDMPSSCIVNKSTCAHLPNSTTYQAVGDISKSNDTYVSIESRGRERMDLSKTVLSSKTTSMYDAEMFLVVTNMHA